MPYAETKYHFKSLIEIFIEQEIMATTKPVAPKKEIVYTPLEKHFGLDAGVRAYTNSKATPIEAACPSLLYGVELEIEHADRWEDWEGYGYSFKEDHSLRNNGRELVTQPMTISVLKFCLEQFFERSKVTEFNYSERCSVHVHANCRDLSLDQVSVVALLYQVFEVLLFQFIGADRNKNIFCVPWYETTLTYNVINNLKSGDHHGLKKWQKYTALNLLPLYRYGTVEFRHMAGTNNLKFIIDWCNLIGCLFAYAKEHTLEQTKEWIIDLNTTSAYRDTLQTVFGNWADLLRTPGFEILLEEGVLNMKYALMSTPRPSLTDDIFGEMIRQETERVRAAVHNPQRPQLLRPVLRDPVEAWMEEEEREMQRQDREWLAFPAAQPVQAGAITGTAAIAGTVDPNMFYTTANAVWRTT